jgi:hypothetical protein
MSLLRVIKFGGKVRIEHNDNWHVYIDINGKEFFAGEPTFEEALKWAIYYASRYFRL